jgi:rhamnosyltransferase
VSVIVIAVVVTYHPDRIIAEQLAALRGQVARVFVVDNGSADERLAHVENHAGPVPLEVVRLGRNCGLGAAHNVGIRRAREAGASHVLLLDQDSVPGEDMVHRMLAAERLLLSQGKRVGAVGPAFHDPRLARTWPFFRLSRLGVTGHRCSDDRHVPCTFLITSGTLIRVEVLDDVGLLNEDFFLEHVDTDWCLRAWFSGYALYGICGARMLHHLGDASTRVPVTRQLVQIYPPYRLYYTFRNSMLLWRERHAPLAWKLNELKRLALRLVFFPIFVAPRLQRLRFMLLGLWHGLLGRTGPLRA